MKRTFFEAIKNRRSNYTLSPVSPVSDKEIEEILSTVINSAPSAFHSQSARVVLLLHAEHQKFWNIVLDTLKKIVPPENFSDTQNKIEASFLSGYGTVLFFDDTEVSKQLQQQFPSYADNFPIWAQQSIGILQFGIWTALADAGFGASLQHYNPIIDDEVKAVWEIPASWSLLAQMPFGTPTAQPDEKERLPISQRLLIKA